MEALDWLLGSAEPWTRFRVLVDLLGRSETDPEVMAAHQAMVAHEQVRQLVDRATGWGEVALKRHNDAAHALHALSTLADFGMQYHDPGMGDVVEKVLAHQSVDGPFQTPVFIPAAFGGPNHDLWTCIACDAPVLLYALLGLGLVNDDRVRLASKHLAGNMKENGFRCSAAAELGRFKGPGNRSDPCPIANVYALKALSLIPEMHSSPAVARGVDMLLSHWDSDVGTKYFLFGVGKKFRKLKYPFVWYDLLHVADVLSRFSIAHRDLRFRDMIAHIKAQADAEGRYTAGSMYQAWKGWSFADKKQPSPWLTFLVLRVLSRAEMVT